MREKINPSSPNRRTRDVTLAFDDTLISCQTECGYEIALFSNFLPPASKNTLKPPRTWRNRYKKVGFVVVVAVFLTIAPFTGA